MIALAAAALAAAAPSPYGFSDALWDDGFAEVSQFRGERTIYGKGRPHDVTMILVKEDFDPEALVKRERPGGLSLPVLKLALHAVIPTENYPYDFFLTLFVRRDDPWSVVKVVANVHEHCGNTSHLFRAGPAPARLEWHSYWEGEGDGAEPLALGGGVVLEDQLAVSLRALPFAAGYRRRLRVVPSLLSNRRVRGAATDAMLEVSSVEPVDPGGPFPKAPRVDDRVAAAPAEGGAEVWRGWKVRVRADDGAWEHSYWFSPRPPHVLMGFKSSDGRSWTHPRWVRQKYWEKPAQTKVFRW